jgi:hypothetical protein
MGIRNCRLRLIRQALLLLLRKATVNGEQEIEVRSPWTPLH